MIVYGRNIIGSLRAIYTTEFGLCIRLDGADYPAVKSSPGYTQNYCEYRLWLIRSMIKRK